MNICQETNIITIVPIDWEAASDGLYYVHIPFETNTDDEDTIMEFIDDNAYITEHAKDFDALNNGITENGVCIISADHKPSCNMRVQIKTITEAGGEVLYDKYGNPKYVPPERPSSFGLDLAGGLPFDQSGHLIK